MTPNFRLLAVVAGCAASLAAFPVAAENAAPLAAEDLAEQARDLSDDQRARIASRLQEFQDRLALTEEQQIAVRPILAAGLEDRLAILKRYGFAAGEKPDLSFRERRALRSELKAVRDRMDEQLSGVLSPEQMAEYRKIQQEQRSEMREKMQNRR